MKDIVIIAHFCRDFSKTDNGRFMYLAKKLAKENRVEIITSDFSHSKKTHKLSLEEKLPFNVIFLHEPGYKKNVCIKRLYSHYRWGKNVNNYLKGRKTPDVIYCAVPSLTAPLKVRDYCKKNNIKFIVDIQDVWPEAFQMVFHVPIISDIAFAPMKWMANQIYSYADEIVAVSDTYCQRAKMVNSKVKETYTVFLGTDLSTFDQNVQNNIVKRTDDEIWLGYCGTLGHSYDLKCVIDAMSKLKKQGVSNLKFIVMGDGPLKDEFERYVKESDVNAEFTGRLHYDEMCGKLAACDIAINCISKGAAQSIINKHSDYAAAGIPVVSTQECAEYKELVERYQMGFNCENENHIELAECIKKLILDSRLRKQMGRDARKCAEEKFDRKRSYGKIIEVIVNEEK